MEDVDAIWPLVKAFGPDFDPGRNQFASSFRSFVDDESTLLLVAEGDGREIVGYLLATMHLTLLERAPVVWVAEVMVNEAQRRQGIGRLLMEWVEQWGRSNRAPYVALASRRAGHFYDALGYADAAVFYKKLLSGL